MWSNVRAIFYDDGSGAVHGISSESIDGLLGAHVGEVGGLICFVNVSGRNVVVAHLDAFLLPS